MKIFGEFLIKKNIFYLGLLFFIIFNSAVPLIEAKDDKQKQLCNKVLEVIEEKSKEIRRRDREVAVLLSKDEYGKQYSLSFSINNEYLGIEPNTLDEECKKKIKELQKKLKITLDTSCTPKTLPTKKCAVCVYDWGGSAYHSGETSSVVGVNKNKESLDAWCKKQTSDCPRFIGASGEKFLLVPGCKRRGEECRSQFFTECENELNTKYSDKEYPIKKIINDEEKQFDYQDINDLAQCKEITLIKNGHGEEGGVTSFVNRSLLFIKRKLSLCDQCFLPVIIHGKSGGCSDFENCNTQACKDIHGCEEISFTGAQITVRGSDGLVIPKDKQNSFFTHARKICGKTEYQLPYCLQKECSNHDVKPAAPVVVTCTNNFEAAYQKWYNEEEIKGIKEGSEVRKMTCCQGQKAYPYIWTIVDSKSLACPKPEQIKEGNQEIDGACTIQTEDLFGSFGIKEVQLDQEDKKRIDLENPKITPEIVHKYFIIKTNCLEEENKKCQQNKGKFFVKKNAQFLDNFVKNVLVFSAGRFDTKNDLIILKNNLKDEEIGIDWSCIY